MTLKEKCLAQKHSPRIEQQHVHRGQGEDVKADVELIGICSGAIVDRLASSGMKQKLLLYFEWIGHVRQSNGSQFGVL